jgi:hypothetical protein
LRRRYGTNREILDRCRFDRHPSQTKADRWRSAVAEQIRRHHPFPDRRILASVRKQFMQRTQNKQDYPEYLDRKMLKQNFVSK